MSWLKFDEFILLDKQLDNWLANKSISNYEVSPRWLIVIMTSTYFRLNESNSENLMGLTSLWPLYPKNLQTLVWAHLNCYTSIHLSCFDIKTQAFKHLVGKKLHDSNHLMAEAVTEQKVVITVMILILSSCYNKKRDKRRN